MQTAKLVFIGVLSLSLAVLIIQNTAPMRAQFLWWSAELPAIVLLALTGVGGFLAGLLVVLAFKAGGRRQP